jgi:23S rRNA (adenine1618-N6)-methyltransferase
VAQAIHLPAIREALAAVEARQVVVIDMAQGVKKSRLVAWSFFSDAQARAWRQR